MDLILHIGSNGLRAGVNAASNIEGYKQIVQSIRMHYQKVFGTAILRGEYTEEQNEQREIANDWMSREEANFLTLPSTWQNVIGKKKAKALGSLDVDDLLLDMAAL
jgi:hypothetical protein